MSRVRLRISSSSINNPINYSNSLWTIAYIEYRKLVRQNKINRLIERIRERAEDSGNESDGDMEELSTMVDMGRLGLLDVNNV
uniref:Protein Vpu n=1 Tax=Human immunodeficiency virus type 1 TaxID=11676 RepID=A0A0A0UTS2_HV1|nr:vpu protein [Human immunodeficiency virus 1]